VTIRRTIINRRNRRNLDPSQRTVGTPASLEAVITVESVLFTSNQPIVVAKDDAGDYIIPAIVQTGAAGTPTLVDITPLTATTFNVVWSSTVAAATRFTWPHQDPAVRTRTGGYVLSGSVFP